MHHSTLLTAVEREAQVRGAVLVVVVWAQRDQAKRALLRAAGLSVASEWYVRLLEEPRGCEVARPLREAGVSSVAPLLSALQVAQRPGHSRRQAASPSPRLVVQHATATKVATEGAMGRRALHVELPAKFCVSPPGERTAHSAGFVPMRGSVPVGRR